MSGIACKTGGLVGKALRRGLSLLSDLKGLKATGLATFRRDPNQRKSYTVDALQNRRREPVAIHLDGNGHHVSPLEPAYLRPLDQSD